MISTASASMREKSRTYAPHVIRAPSVSAMNARSTPVSSAAAISAATSMRDAMARPDRTRIRCASGEARNPARSMARRRLAAFGGTAHPDA